MSKTFVLQVNNKELREDAMGQSSLSAWGGEDQGPEGSEEGCWDDQEALVQHIMKEETEWTTFS